MQKLIIRRQGYGTPLATMEFIELPTADGSLLRIYTTEADADTTSRHGLARMLLAFSRLGAVMVGPHKSNEFGLQLVNNSPLDEARTIALLEAAKKSLKLPAGAKVFYFPTPTQKATAATFADKLEAAGFTIADPRRWAKGNQIYSSGWAVGRMVYVPTAQIDAKYASGELKPTDILITDDVPAEVPHVAGIVSLEASTANSHVALLAKSHNIPFAFANDPAQAAKIKALSGKEVALQASESMGNTLVALELSEMPAAFRKQLVGLLEPAPLVVTAKATTGSFGQKVDGLGPESLKSVGSKAANYAILRKALPPESVPEATALTFDVWDAFMKQKVPSSARPGASVTLEAEIAARLTPFKAYPPPNMAALKRALDGVRELIRDTELPNTVKTGIADTIKAAGFNPGEELRFRSSTNVEDTDTFTGAGLYESFSGTLARDIGGPVQPGAGNRGAFGAVRRTIASFYNDNAFLERRRLKVDETKVGMAMLVHRSMPDERELANGVVTVTIDEFGGQSMEMVSKVGAEPVTNPEPDSTDPEVMSVYRDTNTNDVSFIQKQPTSSPKVRLGENIYSDDDYKKFGTLFGEAAAAFASVRGKTPPLTVDLEFKKALPAPGDPPGNQFIVKQIRMVPKLSGTVPTALMPAVTALETSQGEGVDVFAAHAMKSRWKVTNEARWLSGPNQNLTTSPMTNIEVDYIEGGVVKRYAGPLSGFNQYAYKATGTSQVQTNDSWVSPAGKNELTVSMPDTAPVQDGPVRTLASQPMVWSQKLTKAVNVLRYEVDPATSMTKLVKKAEKSVSAPLEKNVIVGPVIERWNFKAARKGLAGADVLVAPRYRYADQPVDQMVKTDKLGAWEHTTIQGLTSTPLVLKGWFSQTMEPKHHNEPEVFVFEPALEEGISAQALRELKSQNIRKIFIDENQKFWVAGDDGKWRTL